MDFFIADTHFGHKNIVKYTGRPSNYIGLIMAGWRKKVKADDTVYHLGDLSFYNKEITTKILNFLPGKKYLLRGNHDNYHGKQWYVDVGINKIISSTFIYLEGVNCVVVLSHAPLSIDKQKEMSAIFQNKILINIHGHIHEKNSDELYERLNNVVFFNISVEHTNMCPLTLEEIFNQLYTSKKINFLTP